MSSAVAIPLPFFYICLYFSLIHPLPLSYPPVCASICYSSPSFSSPSSNFLSILPSVSVYCFFSSWGAESWVQHFFEFWTVTREHFTGVILITFELLSSGASLIPTVWIDCISSGGKNNSVFLLSISGSAYASVNVCETKNTLLSGSIAALYTITNIMNNVVILLSCKARKV